MLAGPNGSGKSVLASILPRELMGVFLNADDLERRVAQTGQIDLRDYGLAVKDAEILRFLHGSPLLAKAGLLESLESIDVKDGVLSFGKLAFNSYHASAVIDLVRQNLLLVGATFTFETVMSFPDKVDFLRKARERGYRTYLYYIATEDPVINIARVAERVRRGGHDVPEDKIRQRYTRSLDLLWSAIGQCNRAYVFDNTREQAMWIAEFTDGQSPDLKTREIPAWFKHAVLDKIPRKELP